MTHAGKQVDRSDSNYHDDPTQHLSNQSDNTTEILINENTVISLEQITKTANTFQAPQKTGVLNNLTNQ
jgi:hypothetical protein